jgi:hypothetical protein
MGFAARASSSHHRYVPHREAFLPQESTPVRCGHETISVYPKIPPTASDNEKSHAFHVTASALDVASTIQPKARTTFLAEYMGLGSEMIMLLADMTDDWNGQWCHPAQMTLINFMDIQGQVIHNCLDNAGALKAVQDGLAADCRPDGLKYMTVSTHVVFANNEQLQFTQTFELPQGARQVTRQNGHQADLTTYLNDDPLGMSVDEFRLVILDPQGRSVPLALLEPAFGSTRAVVDDRALNKSLLERLHEAHWETNKVALHRSLCPNYTSDPCAAVQAIHQVTIDKDGNEIVLDLKVYNASFMRAIRPVAHEKRAPINYAQQYVQNLDSELRTKLESKTNIHLRNIDRSRKRQMEVLNLTMEHALKVDKGLTSLRSMINHQKTEMSGMLAQVMSAVTKTPVSSFMMDGSREICVDTLVSQAEKCIRDNNGGSGTGMTRSFFDNGCWGCGSKNHSWWNKKLDKAECPDSHNPDYIARAAKTRLDFVASRKKDGQNKRKGRGKGGRDRSRGGGSDRPTKEVRLSNETISAVTEVMTAIFKQRDDDAASVITGVTTGTVAEALPAAAAAAAAAGVQRAQGGRGRRNQYVGTNYILNVSLATRLPVPIHPQLPHIYHALGPEDLAEECVPLIPGMVDSCAAVNTARSDWILPIIKRYPFIVKAVVNCDDGRHSPLVLAGVVGDESILDKLSTKLPIMIELFTPYRTRSGEPMSIQFAVGKNLSVNCIFGLPWFMQFGVVLDTVNAKVIAQNVDCNPFDVFYKVPSRDPPKLPNGAMKCGKLKPTLAMVAIHAIERRSTEGPSPPDSSSAPVFTEPLQKKPRHERSDDDESLFGSSDEDEDNYVGVVTPNGEVG